MARSFKLYQRLMPNRIRKMLIISSPYDAFIMEEDGGMIEHVFMNVRGISLVEPPKFTVVSTIRKALNLLQKEHFDLIVHMPRVLGPDTIAFAEESKQIHPDVPVVLLVPSMRSLKLHLPEIPPNTIDNVFVWSGNRLLLWAIIKWAEDRMNVEHDTKAGMVRVLIFVEDSPYFYSSLLPVLYRSLVKQTHAVLDDTLNEEHRLLKLRGRPKILLAKNYEEAVKLFRKFKPYLLGIFSDIRFPRKNKMCSTAGIDLLTKIQNEYPNLPKLVISSEFKNKEKARQLEARFQDKNSPSLHSEIKKYLLDYMGFGDFVFKLPNGEEVGRASNLAEMEEQLRIVPNESLMYHVALNHFSNWFFARAEVGLATQFRDQKHSNFEGIEEIRNYLINSLHEMKIKRQRGVIATFRDDHFDPDSPFLTIGDGSLGGKARGLAFMAKYLRENLHKFDEFEKLDVTIPKTLVITTDLFDQFIDINNLSHYSKLKISDEKVAERFLQTNLPPSLENSLRVFLGKVKYPIAVRSSSLLEDSKDEPYAGLYSTYMLPNNHNDIEERLRQLSMAIKLVYASIFYEGPKAFARTTQHRTEEEKMAVMIQQVLGQPQGDYFYPTLSGTAQSYNFYPLAHVKAVDGIAQVSLGLGKIIVEGGQSLRFCPKYPENLPQFSSVDNTLNNSQKYFFALKMPKNDEINPQIVWTNEEANLEKRDIFDARAEMPVKDLAGAYIPTDHIIRDSYYSEGVPVLTFASILKHKRIPLDQTIETMLNIGKEGFGSDVEIEYAVNISSNRNDSNDFVLLQARPMTTHYKNLHITINKKEIDTAFCHSTNALGRNELPDVRDIIFVKPDTFSSQYTVEIAGEISKMNAELFKKGRRYILAGPGRWGSSDQHLGIPVKWQDISATAGIIEASLEKFHPDPSQGTHFFQNITSLGILYFTVHSQKDFLDWKWLMNQEVVSETPFVRHVRLKKLVNAKINGRKNQGILSI